MTTGAQRTHSYVYARVSSLEQVENSSLDEQVRRCAHRAVTPDHSVLGIYREEGESGTTEQRPAWQALMTECRAGRVNTIYALNWKRLARSARVGLQIAEELEQLGVDLVVVEADFDTRTPTGRLLRHQMIGFAAFDRDSIVEQMARGQHAMAAKNLWPSGSASPYGFRATGGKTNTLIHDQAEADTVRLMATWIIDEGMTTGEVCRRLNAMGRATRHGKQWTHSNLRRILRQRVILGEIVWGGSEPSDGRKYKSYRPKGYGPAKHLIFEPILSEERWAALQVALDVRATGPRVNRMPYALAGRLHSPCGVNYGGVHRADRGLRQYRCRTRQWTAADRERCNHPLLMADEVEDRVWQSVASLLGDRERLLSLAQDYLGIRLRQVGAERDEMHELKLREQRLAKAQRKTIVDLVRAGLEADDIKAATDAVASDLREVRARIREVEAWAADLREGSRKVTGLSELAEVASSRLSSMGTVDRARVLALLDVHVTVLDSSRNPALRIEGTLCHDKLVNGFGQAGDLGVAGTPPAAPPRR